MRTLLVFLLFIFIQWTCYGQDVPYLSGRVNDYAHLLSESTRQDLENMLKDHEQRTTNQIAILTTSGLDGENIEDFAVRTFEAWQLGQKGKDNGALMVIAAEDRKLRIETGYGLEPYLTDADASRIIRDMIIPYFRQGNYEQGIVRGTQAMLAKIEGITEFNEAGQKPHNNQSGGYGILAILLGIVSVITGFFLIKKRRRNAPRTSRKTGLPMHRLSDKEEDIYLSKGQQTEEKTGSVDYDVWVSEQPDDVLILPYKNTFNQRYSTCPNCGYITFYHAGSNILRSATYSHDGEGQRKYACKHCNHTETRPYRIPRLRRSRTVIIPGGGGGGARKGSGGFSGGSFSGRGGFSGGGGASGSW